MQRLRTVLDEYLKYSKHHNKVDISEVDTNIIVKWYDSKSNWWPFEQIEFPKQDLDKRIEHYNNKLKNGR